MYNIKEANLKELKNKNTSEINSFYKKEISEGIYEIKEPYKPEEKIQNKKLNPEKLLVTGFDDFFKKSNKEKSSEISEKEKIDQILGLNKSKSKNKITKPLNKVKRLKYQINSVKKKEKKKKLKKETKEK